MYLSLCPVCEEVHDAGYLHFGPSNDTTVRTLSPVVPRVPVCPIHVPRFPVCPLEYDLVDFLFRIWDLPTGRMVDWMWFKKAVTGVTVSPTGEFMCTSHHGRVGLSVWADQR